MEISLQSIVLFSVLTFTISYFAFNGTSNKKEINSNEEVIIKSKASKLNIVIRGDAKIDKQRLIKLATQSTLAAIDTASQYNPQVYRRWSREGQPKVTLKCPDENEMNNLIKSAKKYKVHVQSINDKTTNKPLILAVGPDYQDKVNMITGHLKLF
ncbi:peptidyl-tRNA hydrolase II [Neocallimastix lanati (nom. inval.)]|uniref:peptidyl-tRNA hydrolase n=1 Tax=Neocallimastix californiae TaxID=1754190 RepID=A0A1Y2AH10_9FUNG|nr:peptidyl-tRNA hydrolase II [Neocallimastix sp. JGI-2020a]ORY21265.1 peptidyl-tRNA hydrolase II [Neocallimastix californiae]|eukprot:ORY21265.1 peptidyl-tRNA hydrolase II [Neocallimastix californiae]